MEKIDKALEWILYIVLFSIFINFKAFFNVGIILLLIASLIKIIKYRAFSKDKIFYWYFVVMIVGIIANLVNGTLGKFLSIERSIFFIPLFLMMNLKLSHYEKVKKSMIYGGIVGTFYSIISYFTPNFLGIKTLYYDYKTTGRMQSFVNAIRWGNLLQILSIYPLITFRNKKSKTKKIMLIFLILSFMFALVINGTRAGMVGIAVGALFISIMLMVYFGKKYMKHLLIMFCFFGIFYFILESKRPDLTNRIKSIASTTHPSNRTRLDLYRAGLEISKKNLLFGTGSGTSAIEFENFILNSNKEYKEKYYNNSIKLIPGDPFENNYINMLVENGFIYLISYICFIFYVIVTILKRIRKVEKYKQIKILLILATFIGSKTFAFFFPGTDSYVTFINVFLIFYANEISLNKYE